MTRDLAAPGSASGDLAAPGSASGDLAAPGSASGELSGALIAAGRRVGAKQLTWGTAGNISVRLPDGRFLISGSGRRIDELDADGLVACSVGDDAWSGSCRPSVETDLHRGIYVMHPEAGAVLHSSAFHTTLVACSAIELEPAASTDTLYYIRRVARLPFLVPGSRELAEAVTEAAREHDVILLGNHGSVVYGEDLHDAVNKAEALELMCRMLVARTQGFPLLPIAEELREDALRRMDE